MVKDKTKFSLSEIREQARDFSRPVDVAACAGKHVLVVDDNVDFTMLLCRFLNTLEVEVSVARDGTTALALCASGTFDAILIDIQMPVLDGLETTRRLRGNGCVVPILAISAHAMTQHEQLARDAGCTAFYSKPISMAKLAEALALAFTPVSLAP